MKKLFSIFIVALMLFSLAGCGEPEYMPYNKINVELLTDENFNLPIDKKLTLVPGADPRGTYQCELKQLFVSEIILVEQEISIFNFNYTPSEERNVSDIYGTLNISIKEVKEYVDLIVVEYVVKFRVGMRWDAKEEKLYDYRFDSSGIQNYRFRDYIEYPEGNYFDPSLYMQTFKRPGEF